MHGPRRHACMFVPCRCSMISSLRTALCSGAWQQHASLTRPLAPYWPRMQARTASGRRGRPRRPGPTVGHVRGVYPAAMARSERGTCHQTALCEPCALRDRCVSHGYMLFGRQVGCVGLPVTAILMSMEPGNARGVLTNVACIGNLYTIVWCPTANLRGCRMQQLGQ